MNELVIFVDFSMEIINVFDVFTSLVISSPSAKMCTVEASNFLFASQTHQVKTKKITTVKEVWVPGLN